MNAFFAIAVSKNLVPGSNRPYSAAGTLTRAAMIFTASSLVLGSWMKATIFGHTATKLAHSALRVPRLSVDTATTS